MLLGGAHEAVQAGGAASPFGLLMSLNMLIETPGGGV